MKLPFIKFYPRDWQADIGLRQCSLESRGLWFEMLCIMAQSERYGYLVNGDGSTPLSDEVLCRLIGCPKGDLYRSRDELKAAGVPGIDEKTGAWFNRRMVKESHKRELCSRAGKSGGGNPALNSKSKKPDTRVPDTRNHISINPSLKDDLYRSFEAVWKEYPDKSGKQKSLEAYLKWRKAGDTQETVLDGIERYRAYVEAKRANGQDLSWRNGSTFFHQRCWNDEWKAEQQGPVSDSKQPAHVKARVYA